MPKQSLTSWGLFVLLSIIWGSSFILMKKAAEDLNGWQIGATRILAAGLVLLPFAIFHINKIPLRKLPLVIVSGALGNLFPAFLFAIAIENIPSSLAAILNSLTPLFVIVIGILFFRDKIERNKILGVVTGLAGLVILNLSKGSIANFDPGFTLLIFLATLCYGFNVNMVGHYLKEIEPVRIASVSMAFIAIPAGLIAWKLNVFSMAVYDDNARWALGLVAVLGISGTAIATAIFYVLIQRSGGLFASLVTYAIPIVAIFWGLLANEKLGWIQALCLALILAGVYLANLPKNLLNKKPGASEKETELSVPKTQLDQD